MKEGVFYAIIFGFLIGVFLRSVILIGTISILFFSIVALGIGVASYVEKRYEWIVIVFFLFSVSLGVIRMQQGTLIGNSFLSSHLESMSTIKGIIVAEPDVRDTSIHLTILMSTVVLASSTKKINEKIIASVPVHTNVSYGDEVEVHGTLTTLQNFETSTGRVFNYVGYEASNGVGYAVKNAQVKVIGHGYGNYVIEKVLWVKRKYLDGLAAVLPEPESGLAGGITVGDKHSVGVEISKEFQNTSLIHVLVLSGYNITVVVSVLGVLMRRAPLLAVRASILTIIGIFMIIAGGASSALRSGLMACVTLYARESRRTIHALRAVLFVCTLMVLWNPWVLAFDPSFQLSSLATIGLILCSEILVPYFKWVTEKYGMREIMVSTSSAQLFVLPLLLYQNGNLSPYAIFANVVALIPVPFAMLMSLIAGIVGIVSGAALTFLALPAYVSLIYIIFVARFFAHLPFATIMLPPFDIGYLFLSYGIIISSILFHNKKRRLLHGGASLKR